jgi:succinoglycan biosynthesis transport protein ExoP
LNKYFALPAKNNSSSRNEVVALSHPKSEASEAYRALRTSILLAGGTAPQVLLVTSPLPQEGKTTTCINCGIMLAQQGRRVLLIDADLRRPSIHMRLKMKNERGLTNILTGRAIASECIVKYPEVPNLSVLTAGSSPPRPSELLGSEVINDLLSQWRKEYDHILIDSPPALSVTDAVLLSPKCDRVVLVIRAGQTTKGALSRARDLLLQVNAQVLGVVVNAVDLNAPQYYYYSYGSSHRSYYTDDTRVNTSGT